MGRLRSALLGLTAGLINGLFGSGGGIIAVPMLRGSGMSTKESHAASIALTLPLSVVSCIFYAGGSGNVVPVSLRLIPFGLAGAAAGVALMKKISPVALRKVFGVILIFSGVRLFLR